MAIDARGTSAEVDFRVSLAEARTVACDLPDHVATALRLLMKRLDLDRRARGRGIFGIARHHADPAPHVATTGAGRDVSRG